MAGSKPFTVYITGSVFPGFKDVEHAVEGPLLGPEVDIEFSCSGQPRRALNRWKRLRGNSHKDPVSRPDRGSSADNRYMRPDLPTWNVVARLFASGLRRIHWGEMEDILSPSQRL
jgi:hypothetical protein